MIRKLTSEEEAGTMRVAVGGLDARYLTESYDRMRAVQDDLVTVLYGICRVRGLDPDDVVGFDDEHGELLVRPRP